MLPHSVRGGGGRNIFIVVIIITNGLWALNPTKVKEISQLRMDMKRSTKQVMRLYNFIQRAKKKKKKKKSGNENSKVEHICFTKMLVLVFSSDSLVIKLEDKMRLRHL